MAMPSAESIRNGLASRIASCDQQHKSYKWWIMATVMIGTFMAVLDATIVNVALNKIMASFGIPIEKAEWVLTAYMLVMAVMMPTSGWIADHFGYKRTYLFSLFVFTLGSLLCALSWNANALIFFRVIQGMGTGMLMPVGMAIVTREFPPEKRGMALGFWGIAAAASVSFGPALGGYLTDSFSWQSIFYINVPVGIVALFGVWLFQHEFKTSKIKSFDTLGFASLAIFLVALLLALAEGNAAWNTNGWTSNFIVSCFLIAALSFIVFLKTELTVNDPLIDLSLFTNFNYSVTNIVLFLFGLGMFGSTFLLPVYLQAMMGYTALQAGMVFMPVGMIQGVMSPIAGML
ncbi:MAG TPA: DHA2 family efflux MFS transporter permease subunit, partial [Planctomycetota bacterium]|nr:DHA2 family efflux MFS transporter permease subunit [Planctomycetota bacterium]